MIPDHAYFGSSGQGESVPDLAALEQDLDCSALEIEASRELVVQMWKLAHRIAGLKAAEKRENERNLKSN